MSKKPTTGNTELSTVFKAGSLIGNKVSLYEYIFDMTNSKKVHEMYVISDAAFKRWRKVGTSIVNQDRISFEADIFSFFDEREFVVLEDFTMEDWKDIGHVMFNGDYKYLPYFGEHLMQLTRALSEPIPTIVCPTFADDGSVYSHAISQTNTITPGLHVVMGKSGQGKSTLLRAIADELNVQVIVSGEPVPGALDVDEGIRRAMLHNEVGVVDSIKNGLYEAGGATATGGVNMTFFSRMALISSYLVQNNRTIFTAINPATEKEDVYSNILEAVKSNATSLMDLDSMTVYSRDFSTGVENRVTSEGKLDFKLLDRTPLAVFAALAAFKVTKPVVAQPKPLPKPGKVNTDFAGYDVHVAKYL